MMIEAASKTMVRSDIIHSSLIIMPSLPFGDVSFRGPHCLGRPVESNIVFDHGGGPDRHLACVGQIELAEDDLVAPDLAEEILEDLNRQLLAWAASVSEAERREAGIVTNRQVLPVDNTENRPETTIGDVCLASILDLEIRDFERASREADLLAFFPVIWALVGTPRYLDGSKAFGSFQWTGARLVLVCGVLM